MASGRILTDKTTNKNWLRSGFYSNITKINLFGAFALAFLMIGCGTTGNTQKTPLPSKPKKEKKETVSDELKDTLNETRSELKDTQPQKDEVPAYFLKETDSSNRNIGNPYTGFRVQIISTRNRSKAESIAAEFRVWADKHISGYFPQAYLVFDQPYFKVHIGNFQFQQRASNFTQMIKSKYPGAWVVHDRIDPEAVPKQDIHLVK